MQTQSDANSDDDEIIEALRKAKEAARGYADFDTWPESPIRDRGIALDFAESLRRDLNVSISNIRTVQPNQDPPDVIADDAIGIELTELVDPSLVRAAVRQKESGESPNQYRDWSPDDLLGRLQERIRHKDRAEIKTPVSSGEYWLVIHTDEPGLTPELVRTYLGRWKPVQCQLLTRCFFLMSYFPSAGGRPLFELSVNTEAASG